MCQGRYLTRQVRMKHAKLRAEFDIATFVDYGLEGQ